jgi:hypothetical protein
MIRDVPPVTYLSSGRSYRADILRSGSRIGVIRGTKNQAKPGPVYLG